MRVKSLVILYILQVVSGDKAYRRQVLAPLFIGAQGGLDATSRCRLPQEPQIDVDLQCYLEYGR